MSISMNNFDAATDTKVSGEQVAAAVAEARLAVGYSLEQLAVTTGLTIDQLTAVENGEGADASLLHRIATALGLPAATFVAV
ncbi:MAG: helix-turn-helix domain-containing protein [Pseudorhizobium sp.]